MWRQDRLFSYIEWSWKAALMWGHLSRDMKTERDVWTPGKQHIPKPWSWACSACGRNNKKGQEIEVQRVRRRRRWGTCHWEMDLCCCSYCQIWLPSMQCLSKAIPWTLVNSSKQYMWDLMGDVQSLPSRTISRYHANG